MKFKDVLRLFFPTTWNLFKMAVIPTALNRRMLRGKLRRFWLVHFRRRTVEGVLLPRRKSTCARTGACCQFGFGCPAYDAPHQVCTIHPYKPLVCKLFPITGEDLKDRDFVDRNTKCGYSFDSRDDSSGDR